MRRGKEQRVLFQLIRSVLLEEPITIEVEGLDWKYLQQLCKYQKIDNLVSYGILPLQEQEKLVWIQQRSGRVPEWKNKNGGSAIFPAENRKCRLYV